jgi:hypothetical protein
MIFFIRILQLIFVFSIYIARRMPIAINSRGISERTLISFPCKELNSPSPERKISAQAAQAGKNLRAPAIREKFSQRPLIRGGLKRGEPRSPAILSLTHGAPLLPENAGPAAVKKGSL